MATKIDSIIDVVPSIPHPNPPQLKVVSNGLVPTSGWEKPKLVPRFSDKNPPKNGRYEFDFEAEAPDVIISNIPREIQAEYLFTPMPRGIKTVAVYSKSNEKEEPVIDPKKI